MCNSEFSESLSNALFSQLKDVFTLYFFDFLFNIKPSTLVLADKTRRLFEVLSLFLLLSLLFCLLGQRHNKLLDRHLIHSLWAIRSRDVSQASRSSLQTLFMLRCSEANVYLLGGFPWDRSAPESCSFRIWLSFILTKWPSQRIRFFLSSVNMIAKFTSFRTSLDTLLLHLILSGRLRQRFRMWYVFSLRKGISYVLFPLISNWPYVVFELIIKRRV